MPVSRTACNSIPFHTTTLVSRAWPGAAVPETKDRTTKQSRKAGNRSTMSVSFVRGLTS